MVNEILSLVIDCILRYFKYTFLWCANTIKDIDFNM